MKKDQSHVTTFLDYLVLQNRSPLTIQGYQNDLLQFKNWFEEMNMRPMTPVDITPVDMQAYRRYLIHRRNFKASTINRRLAALSSYLHWAQEAGLIEDNPAQGTRMVPQIIPGPRHLSKKEQFQLRRTIQFDLQDAKLRFPSRWLTRQRDASLITFLLNTGLRLQEGLTLRKEDVSLSARKGQVLIRQGKGGKQRTVPLNKEARHALQAWLDVRPAHPHPFIWTAVESSTDKPLSSRSVQRVLKRYARAAGLAEISPHMLRHTFAKNLVDAGVGLEKVAALLGHANLNTTRMYITPSQIDLAHAVDMLDELY
jgi:site-specific recombinase XerD